MTVRFLADRVAVMYFGKVVEQGPTEEIFSHPRHPYTKALLDSAPTLDRLMHLPEPPAGEVPDPRTKFTGCRYATRCPNVQDLCRANDPPFVNESAHRYQCFFPVDVS
jgi:oligopeptide/dipeptide ABC transporter ATP-binding protein